MSALGVLIAVVGAVAHTAFVTAQTALVESVPGRFASRSDSSASLRRIGGDPHGTVLGLQTLTALCSVAIGAVLASSPVVFVVGVAIVVAASVFVPRRSVPSAEGSVAALAPFIGPVVRAVSPLTRLVGSLARRSGRRESIDGEQLHSILDESRDVGLISEVDHALIEAVLAFERRTVGEIMVPVERIVSIRRTATVAEAEEAIVASGHSRLPVVDEGRHDVLGFVHAKDLMALPPSRRGRRIPFDVIRMVLVASPDTALFDVLAAMRRARRHVVVITDPRRGTVGMVTMEDILETIVGDIVDESDVGRGGARGD